MPDRQVAVGLHWPNEQFGHSGSWVFDPARVYRQGYRRPLMPWGLWTSPKTSPNGWIRCRAAAELDSIGTHHWEITLDLSDMVTLSCSADVPAEFRWELSELGSELGLELEGWDVDWRAIQDAGHSGVHIPRWQPEDDPHLHRQWWSRFECSSTVTWDLAAVLEVDGPFPIVT